MTASEQLCVSLPNNACRALATIVTCTMHGLRHAPGSNHVCVSFLGVFTLSFVMFVGALTLSFVISKYNLQLSDGTSHLYLGFLYRPVPFPIVPFLICGFYPHLALHFPSSIFPRVCPMILPKRRCRPHHRQACHRNAQGQEVKGKC